MRDSVAERERARERGSHRARLQYPQVDLAQCLGCGTCVRACPEEGVLDLVHGQAVVIHGARCVGHGLCALECPTGAIRVELGDLDKRRDIPVLDEQLEVPGTPGLFLAGEVTGYALIRTAIAHGTAVAGEVARRTDRKTTRKNKAAAAQGETLDLCVVGAGPAGIACSLEATSRGLTFVTLEQEQLGGTVASYPRRKLVMTQPVELPLHGKLTSTSYTKEELMELWQHVADEHALPIKTDVSFEGLDQDADGVFTIRTGSESFRARNVCLALGRRGTPRKLGVPGEDLPKVTYGLIDAQSYEDRDILVVGGGDSAIEAALGLAEQPGNRVTLSYRKHAFFRIKARNEQRLDTALSEKQLEVWFESTVATITPDQVDLHCGKPGKVELRSLRNDDVFVFAGGVPPFGLLEASGVSLDPAQREAPAPRTDESAGLLRSLAVAMVLAAFAAGWILFFRNYYSTPLADRGELPEHVLLRPSAGVGLGLGIAAVALVLFNLAYLLRRGDWFPLCAGSLRTWMTSHLVTGTLALFLALIHGAMAPRPTAGGHALLALAVLVCTGAIGRYFYSFVPHAANGLELAFEEVRARLAKLSAEFDRGERGFGQRVRHEIEAVTAAGHWESSFPRRVVHLIRAQASLRTTLARLEQEGRAEGLSEDQIRELVDLVRRARREALMATHFEDLRGLLATWRFVHRWIALLMVLLVTAHVVSAVRFGGLFR